MTSVIEETVKALVEFESALDRAADEAKDAKNRLVKESSNWAESAKASAIAKAQQAASERVAVAREAAEMEAQEIKEKGAASLKDFESSISKRKSKAAEAVVVRLLGEES